MYIIASALDYTPVFYSSLVDGGLTKGLHLMATLSYILSEHSIFLQSASITSIQSPSPIS